jgi:DNA-directed RNA polymerase subunit M/transcription elongation factor TFIIS
MMENDNKSDYSKNALMGSHADKKQCDDNDKSERKQEIISQNEKEAEVDHILTDNKERKNNKNYSKKFKCDKCDKRYTWYSGLSNHKRFVHNKLKET